MGYGMAVLQNDKSSENSQWGRLHNNMNVLNTIELSTKVAKRVNLSYMYFTTIEKKRIKKQFCRN
jgi:hypothetical protein